MNNQDHTSERLGIGGADTSFVLFFLALEWGRYGHFLSLEGSFMGVTLLMVLVLPYFLPSLSRRPTLTTWIAGRGAFGATGMILGAGLASLGGVAAGLQLLPMTLLIIASIVSCYVQFFSVLRLRPAK